MKFANGVFLFSAINNIAQHEGFRVVICDPYPKTNNFLIPINLVFGVRRFERLNKPLIQIWHGFIALFSVRLVSVHDAKLKQLMSIQFKQHQINLIGLSLDLQG